MTSTEPWALYRFTLPSEPTLTTTRLGITTPGGKFKFEAIGRVTPLGNTVRKLPAEGSTAVTLRATAVTPLAGTGLTPAIFTARVELAPSRPPGPPVPFRVSRMRVGVTAL